VAEHERNDDRVIEVARDRDEVGDDVERHRQVGNECCQDDLLAPRDARVAHKPPEKNDAVGHEPSNRAGRVLPTDDDQRGNEREVHGQCHSYADEKPVPRVHDRQHRGEAPDGSETTHPRMLPAVAFPPKRDIPAPASLKPRSSDIPEYSRKLVSSTSGSAQSLHTALDAGQNPRPGAGDLVSAVAAAPAGDGPDMGFRAG